MSTPCPTNVARGRATRLCWGPIDMGFWISKLRSIVDAVQAQKTPRKWKMERKEDRLV